MTDSITKPTASAADTDRHQPAQAIDNQADDFLFIPAGVWHQPIKVSERPVVVIEARADADDQSNVILAPDQP